MKPEDIHLYDWSRILLGQVPPSFYIEVILRAASLYLLLMISMRLMGKRMAAQLSRNERVSMVALAAATGIPLQAAERGLLPAFVIAFVVIVAGRLIAIWAFRHQGFEQAMQGNASMLVADGVMDISVLRKTRISKDRLFSTLRGEGIMHLGEVKRVYMEAAGGFTVIREEQPQPGLSVLPEWDLDFLSTQTFRPEIPVCGQCGNHLEETAAICNRCGASMRTSAAS